MSHTQRLTVPSDLPENREHADINQVLEWATDQFLLNHDCMSVERVIRNGQNAIRIAVSHKDLDWLPKEDSIEGYPIIIEEAEPYTL